MAAPVVVTRTLAAPIERVFVAWSDPELLRQWFATGGSWVEKAEVDFRPGGAYKILIRDAEGTYSVFGRYERIEEPTLLEFTWQWEESSFEPGVSLVTLELATTGANTELTLTHARLANEKSEEMHTKGWDAVLNRLVSFVAL